MEGSSQAKHQQYIGWLNYLFDEHYSEKQPDAWDSFEYIHKHHPEKEEDQRWLDSVAYNADNNVGIFFTYAVLHGVEKHLSMLKPTLESR